MSSPLKPGPQCILLWQALQIATILALTSINIVKIIIRIIQEVYSFWILTILYVIINYPVCVIYFETSEVNFLIKNNLEIDVKSKCVEEGITQAQLAGKVGTTAPYVNRIIKKPEGVVNKTFMSMMEQLGYDIEMVYVKKKKYE